MKKILSLLLATSSIFSMQLDLVKSDVKKEHIKQIFVPSKLGSVELYHSKKGFFVRKDDQKHVIKKYFTDPIVRDITKKQLNAFLEAGYLSLNQMEDGKFSLKAKGRVNGGGPILGAAAYWITKSLCYCIISAAIITSISSGGGGGSKGREIVTDTAKDLALLGAETGLIYAAETSKVHLSTIAMEGATSLVTTTGPRLISTVAFGAPTTGIGLTTIAIKAADLGKEASIATAAGMVATGSTKVGIVASIELLSLKVGLFFGMTPTP